MLTNTKSDLHVGIEKSVYDLKVAENFMRLIIKIIIIIFIIIYSLEYFTSALADGLSLEIEWQQVSSSLQDSSQYSGRLRKCCCLDGLHSAANFQILQALL